MAYLDVTESQLVETDQKVGGGVSAVPLICRTRQTFAGVGTFRSDLVISAQVAPASMGLTLNRSRWAV